METGRNLPILENTLTLDVMRHHDFPLGGNYEISKN
jgi:hypothetical protein